MSPHSEPLKRLGVLTKESIEQKKKIEYTLSRPQKKAERYYEQYLLKTVGVAPAKTKKGDSDSEKYVSMPKHHKNILLTMAFAKAEKLISELVKQSKNQDKIAGPSIDEDMTNEELQPAVNLTVIEAIKMSSQLWGGKNAGLVKALKQGERAQIKDYVAMLPLLHAALVELRNYHSHILHEPGPLRFENLYEGMDLKGKKSNDERAKAKEWFKKKMTDVKEHQIKSLKEKLNKPATGDKKEDIKDVLSTIEHYEFEKDGYVTEDALLFIVCMFLRKSDAAYFVKKWTRRKKNDGVYKSIETFFTQYSVRDAKSLQMLNADLLQFRKIIGVLCTMPEFGNQCFAPFNRYIKEHNERCAEMLEEIAKKQYSNKPDREKYGNAMIPIRKGYSPIKWYMTYLNDKNLLDGFEVACNKRPEERTTFINNEETAYNVEELKMKMKQATGEEKRVLTKIYKESKRNYVYKSPAESQDEYCVKNDNVLLLFPLYDNKNGKVADIQVTLSCDVLMKWVFAEVILGEGNNVKGNIKRQLKEYYYKLKRGKYGEIKKGYLPPCIADTAKEYEHSYTMRDAEMHIREGMRMLEQFQQGNLQKKAPWKYAAKRKIDIIFEYAHMSYTWKVINDVGSAMHEQEIVDRRRHEAMSDMEYLDALEYIRYFGRYYSQQEFKDFFFEKKKTYFNGIRALIERSTRLEELYTEVYKEYIALYELLLKKCGTVLEKVTMLMKPRTKSKPEDVPKNAQNFATNQVILPELINIQELAKNKNEYEEWNNRTANRDYKNDFWLMRNWLEERNPIDTNTDYLMKVVMPALVKEEQLPLNDEGKIQGFTTMMQTLMKNKGDELLLWEVAKYYWENANNMEYRVPNNKRIEKGAKILTEPYKEKMFFYRLFNEELKVSINDITLKVKAKKFDDELNYYETVEIYKFIKAYKGVQEYYEYEAINKEMKDIMTKYLDDIYLLLAVERKVVLDNYEELTNALHERANNEGDKWGGYQLVFGKQNSELGHKDNLLCKKIIDTIQPKGSEIIYSDLIQYRNVVFHQQMHEDKVKYKKIRKMLTEYCAANNLLPR